jgi:hypothetical protein
LASPSRSVESRQSTRVPSDPFRETGIVRKSVSSRASSNPPPAKRPVASPAVSPHGDSRPVDPSRLFAASSLFRREVRPRFVSCGSTVSRSSRGDLYVQSIPIGNAPLREPAGCHRRSTGRRRRANTVARL